MTDQFTQRDPVEQLAEEFMSRLRRGERPALSEYTTAHPDLAGEIRDLFPALVMMEEVKPVSELPASSAGLGPPPDRLGDYRILREVSRGGMGVVYEAEQVSLGRHVALKILPARSDSDPVRLLRFRREARSAARLHHTNIVPVFDVGATDGVHYYAMQFIQGQGLDEVLQELVRLRSGAKATDASALTASLAEGLRIGTFSSAPFVPIPKPVGSPPTERSAILTGPVAHYFRSVARLGVQAADALAYAHGQRVLHRDVKPSNLLLDRQGTLWLTDFGLAKDDGDDLTRTGDLVGTLRYMAPERFQGVSDPRSDVYALGITLYELLTLRPAFPEVDRVRLVHSVAKVDPPRPRLIDPTIPRDLETIVLKAMEKEPGRRYALAEHLAEDVRRFLADRPILARRASWREQGWRWCRRNPGVAVSLAASAAMLLVGIVVSTWQAVRATQAETLAEERLGGEKEERARAVRAEREGKRQLVGAKLAQVRAGRHSRQPGQRIEGLVTLSEAAALARELKMDEATIRELRDEMVACLALTDVRRGQPWPGLPSGSDDRVEFDADLERYARSDEHGNIEVRQVKGDLLLARLRCQVADEEAGGASLMRFSPDGHLLAVRNRSQLVRLPTNFQVWDWRAGRVVHHAPAMALGENAAEFSPDGSRLAVCLADGTVAVYATDGWEPTARLKTDFARSSLAFHPDGTRLAVADNARQCIQVWALGPDQLVTQMSTPSSENHNRKAMYALAWHPAGILLAAGCVDTNVYLWDAATGKHHATLVGHQNAVVGVKFAPAGDYLLSSGWDDSTRLWDPWAGRELNRFAGDTRHISRDGSRVAGRAGPNLAIWQVHSSRECRVLECAPGAGRSGLGQCDISPDGRWLATGGTRLRFWDLARGVEVGSPGGPAVQGHCFHPTAPELFTSGPDGLYRWAFEAGDQVVTVRPIDRLPVLVPLSGLSLDRAGRRLVAARPSGSVILDPTNPAASLLWLDHPNATASSVSPAGAWAATTTLHGHGVRVWDARSGHEAKRLHSLDRITRALFSPDDRWLVTATGAELAVWESGTWRPVQRIPQDHVGDLPKPMAFSSDGSVLAIAVSPSAIQLIESGTWRPLVVLQQPDEFAIFSMGFTPDGSRLVTYTVAETARVWDLRRLRERLSESELDWERPPFPPAPPAAAVTPLRVQIDVAAFERLVQAHQDFRGGQAHAKVGRWPEAVVSFSKAIEADPDYHDAYIQRGAAHCELKEWDNAIADYSQALDRNPKDAIALENRGRAQAEKGQWDQAEADFIKAVELAPEKGRIHGYLALLKLEQGDLPGYRKICAGLLARPVMDLSPGEAAAFAWACDLAPDAGVDPTQIVRLAERGSEAAPKNPDVLQKLGAALYRAGRYEAAVKLLTETEAAAVATPYKTAAAEYTWLFLAMAQHRLGRATEARQWLDRAVRTGEPTGAPWNRRQTLGLLRREAEALIKPATDGKNETSRSRRHNAIASSRHPLVPRCARLIRHAFASHSC